MKQILIAHIAKSLKSYGYAVYISGDGKYGFYTDGKRVISFGGSWNFSVDFSGNYRTNIPTQTGTGWQIDGGKELSDITEDQARNFINSTAPRWAVGGAKIVNYTTPEQYLATYQPSSKYVEFKDSQS